MGRYFKSIILSLILVLFISIDVSALGFNSTSVRIASWYENGQLADSGFISTNPRPLPQYVSNEIGPVSLRLIQWRYTTSSQLAVGRYKITTDITFSSLDGNKIDNFLSINKFDEFGCGTAYNNSTADNMTLISHDLTRLSDTSYRFEYVFDLKSATCNFFSGIIKYGENEYTEKYVINQYGTNNESLSYSVSYSSVEVLNNQEIIDNQDKNTQDVIDNNNQNTQDIIDNQNKNNEELKDTINDNLSSCGPGKNLFDKSKITSNSYINSNGVISSNNTYSLSDFISVISGVLYSYQGISSYIYGAYYDSNYNFIERFPTYPGKQSITIPGNVVYVRFIIPNTDINVFQFEKGPATDYEEYNPKGTCVPVLDETNDKLDNIGGAITDSSPPNISGLGDAAGWLPPGPVDSIVTLPITLLQSLTNNLDSACTPINLPLPFINENMTLACPGTLLKQIDGFWLFWEAFGLIAGVWILYKYFINLYKWVESHLSMDEKESLGKWGGV